MISQTALRRNFAQLLKFCKQDQLYIDFFYYDKAYRMFVIPMGKVPHRHPRPKVKKEGIKKIKAVDCRVCGAVSVAGVCLNPTCPSMDSRYHPGPPGSRPEATGKNRHLLNTKPPAVPAHTAPPGH